MELIFQIFKDGNTLRSSENIKSDMEIFDKNDRTTLHVNVNVAVRRVTNL